jgi:hypothetical protein
MPDELPEQSFMSALTTEHFASQTARNAVIAELTGRAMVYMGAVSSALITFGFVAQAGDLTPFLASVLPALFLLGEFTFIAMLRNAMENIWLVRHLQRIRRYYRNLGPDAEVFFHPGEADRHFDAAMATFGLRRAPLQGLFTGASTIAAVNTILAGVGVALVCVELGAPVGVAVAVSLPVAILLFCAHVAYQQRRFAQVDKSYSEAETS